MFKDVILVVEDDSIEAMDIKKTLESAGYNIPEIASTGQEALEKLSKFKPDLILMDIILKGEKSGIEIAEIIKKNYGIPVIYLTAHSEDNTIEMAKLTGPYAYLVKPFDPKELIRTINITLNKDKMEKQLEDSNEHFQNLFENAPIGIFHSSLDGKFIRVNKSFSDMFGYESSQEMINDVNNTSIAEKLYVNHNKRPELVEDVLKDEKWHSYKNKYLRRDGNIMIAELCFRAVKDDNSSIIYLEGFVKDVTKEKTAEKALREIESRYRLISENTGDVIWIMDIESERFTYVSPSIYHLAGYTSEELLNLSVSDVMTKESYQYISDNLPQRIELYHTGDESSRVMTTLVNQIHKDGSLVPTEVVTTLLINEKGQIKEILGVSRDIRERIESENKVSEIMLENEYAMDVSKMAYWEFDVLKYTFNFNPRFYSLLGITLEDVGSYEMELDVFIQNYVHPDFVDNVLITVKNAIESGDPYFQFQIECKLQRLHGEAFWVYTWFRGQKDEEGKTIKLLGVTQDITDLKILEESLIESEDKYKTLFEADPDYTILLDTNNFIVDVNKATTNITGLSREEIIGKSFIDMKIIIDEDMLLYTDQITDLLAGNKIKPFEARLIDKNNKLRNINIQITTIEKDNKISYILIIASDITERKQYEKDIKDSLHEKELLLQEIHHRVKNNMQIISSLLNIQTRHVDDEESINILKESQNRVKSLAMIHEKLYRSKDFNKIHFMDYIESLVWDLFYSYSIKKGTIDPILDIDDIKLNIETSVPCGLIITELVSNSLKYAFPDKREGKLKVSLKIKGDYLELTVCDNGIGFPKNIDFKNTDSLGMQLVNSLTDQIDGEIEYDSSNGTKFKITFKELVYKERI